MNRIPMIALLSCCCLPLSAQRNAQVFDVDGAPGLAAEPMVKPAVKPAQVTQEPLIIPGPKGIAAATARRAPDQAAEPLAAVKPTGKPTGKPGQVVQEPLVIPGPKGMTAATAEPVLEPVTTPPRLNLHLVRAQHLLAKLDGLGGRAFFGFLIGSTEDRMIQLPGLPLLLDTKVLLATGPAKQGAMTFDLGKVEWGFTVYLQGVGVSADGIDASPIAKVLGPQVLAAK